MEGKLTFNKVLWLPHLILQRGLGVKDLRNVNFRAHLIQPSFGDLEGWQPKEDKPNLLTQVQAIDDPALLDNKRGQFFDRGNRNPELIDTIGKPYKDENNDWVIDTQPVRGNPVLFKYKGYSTFLFQEEYDLISEVLPNIQEITITTTTGLSPLFQILAVVKKD